MYQRQPPSVILSRDSTFRGLRGMGAEPDCTQPVDPSVRDELITTIKGYTNPWFVTHFAEGHPDLIAIYNDIKRRLSGLEHRPKLVRCSTEARNKANNWIGQIKDLCHRVKSDGVHCSGYTRVPTAFTYKVFNGPTYTIRSTSDPAVNRAMHNHCVKSFGAAACGGGAQAGAATKPTTPTTDSGTPVAPGTVVINGEAFASMADYYAAHPEAYSPAAAPATKPPAGAGATTTTTAAAPIDVGAGGGLPIAMPSFLEGSVAGIPVKYLALGLVGYMLLKRR